MSTSDVTINDVCMEWLGMKRLAVKQSTYAKYYNTIQHHIIPELGDLPLTQVNSSVVNTFTYRKLGSNDAKGEPPLATKTVRDIYTILKSILRYGENEYQTGQLAGNTVLPKKKSECKEILNAKELKKIETYLWENQTDARCVGLLLCMYTGMRLGEICALKWKDIDLRRRLISIQHTMQRITITDENSIRKTQIIMDEPKTSSSIRIIPISSKIYLPVKNLYETADGDCFFLTNTKKYVEPRTYQYFFKRVLKNVGIRDVNFHILRHSFASRCVEVGMDIKTLSEILGHSNTNITLNYYVHSSLESKRRQINMLKI